MLNFNTDQDAAFGNLNGDSFSFPLTVPAAVPEPTLMIYVAVGVGLMLRKSRVRP